MRIKMLHVSYKLHIIQCNSPFFFLNTQVDYCLRSFEHVYKKQPLSLRNINHFILLPTLLFRNYFLGFFFFVARYCCCCCCTIINLKTKCPNFTSSYNTIQKALSERLVCCNIAVDSINERSCTRAR